MSSKHLPTASNQNAISDNDIAAKLCKVIENCRYLIWQDCTIETLSRGDAKGKDNYRFSAEGKIPDRFDQFFTTGGSFRDYIIGLRGALDRTATERYFNPVTRFENEMSFPVFGQDDRNKPIDPFLDYIDCPLEKSEVESVRFLARAEQILLCAVLNFCIEIGLRNNVPRNRARKEKKLYLTERDYLHPEKSVDRFALTSRERAKLAIEQADELFPSPYALATNNALLREQFREGKNLILAIKIEPYLLQSREGHLHFRHLSLGLEKRFSMLPSLFRSVDDLDSSDGKRKRIARALLLMKFFEPDIFLSGRVQIKDLESAITASGLAAPEDYESHSFRKIVPLTFRNNLRK